MAETRECHANFVLFQCNVLEFESHKLWTHWSSYANTCTQTCAQGSREATHIDTYERNYIRRDTHSIRIRIHDADAIRRKWHMSRSPGCLLIQLRMCLRMCLRMRQELKRIHIRRGIARQLWLNSFHYSVDSRCCCCQVCTSVKCVSAINFYDYTTTARQALWKPQQFL